MKLFDIFKSTLKTGSPKGELEKAKSPPKCTDDPSCPMCHIDEKTLKTLKKSAKETTQVKEVIKVC